MDAMRKQFIALGKGYATMRLLILVCKKGDGSEENEITLTVQELVENKIYSTHPKSPNTEAVRGLNNVAGLMKLKINGKKIFTDLAWGEKSRTLYINPKGDFQNLALGFKAFPMRFLDMDSLGEVRSYARRASYALILCSKEHIEEIAEKGYFTTSYRNILENMGLSSSQFCSAKKSLGEAFDKINALKEGIEVTAKPFAQNKGKKGKRSQREIDDYLDKSVATIRLYDNVLTDFLGAFGLKPPIKPDMPFEVSTEEVGEPEQLKLGQNDDLLNSIIRSMTPAELIAVAEAVLGTLKTKIKA